MGVGMDVNISEFLAEFTSKILLSEVILALNSKQGKSGLFWFGCGRKKETMSFKHL